MIDGKGMKMFDTHDMDIALTTYADWYLDKAKQQKSSYDNVHFERGHKFMRVVVSYKNLENRSSSAYAFIAIQNTDKFRIGDILKPASWSGPAKNFARGNVLRPETYQKHSIYGL